MRTSTAILSLPALLCALLAAGCYDQVRKDDLSEDPSRINLRVRILDIATSHLRGYGENIVDIDQLVFDEEALKILRNIFVEVSGDQRYPYCDIDVVVGIRTKRSDASAEAIAEVTVREGYGKVILVRSSHRSEYHAEVHETNDTIRNHAAFRALTAALQSLRDEPKLIEYARERHGEGIVGAPSPESQEEAAASQPAPAEEATDEVIDTGSSDSSDAEENKSPDGQQQPGK